MARRESPLKAKQRAADMREYKRRHDPPKHLQVSVELANARQYGDNGEPRFWLGKAMRDRNEFMKQAHMYYGGMHDALAARVDLIGEAAKPRRPRRRACKRILLVP